MKGAEWNEAVAPFIPHSARFTLHLRIMSLLNDILRNELGFRGVVFSDDISMAAGESEGGIAARIEAHYAAGCDLMLACQPGIVAEALDATRGAAPLDPDRLAKLLGGVAQTWDEMADNPQRRRFIENLHHLP